VATPIIAENILANEIATRHGLGWPAANPIVIAHRSTLLAVALLAALASPTWADSTVIPDPTLTPGAVRTTDVGEICSTGTRQLRHWDRARDDRIMAEYGLAAGAHPDYEVDHLVPLGIGGADADANLWPEPRRSIEPTWNAEAKDRLEWKLRDLVCPMALDVREPSA
jgi:hypothetical protein